jgi:hypothetical protein
VSSREGEGHRFALARQVFLRILGLSYLAAFASFGVQAAGLVGERGILPAALFLQDVHERLGAVALWRLPSLFWLDASTGALQGASVLGVALSAALSIGLAPRWTAAALWVLYLSVVHVGQVFLGYQWDALLLEAGLLAVWLAPAGGGLGPGSHAFLRKPRRAPLFLLRWLLFRLFLLSGLVKLLSGDPTWRDLSAMEFHYWTQPIPSWTSPYVHALPARLHQLETLATLALEIGLPFCMWGPRPLRLVAAAGFVALQLVINLTGNYGFFGLVTLALCALLVDDAIWRRVPGVRRWAGSSPVQSAERAQEQRRGPSLSATLAALAVGVVLLVTSTQALRRLAPAIELPGALRALLAAVDPLDSFHAYGLFAVMTTDRPEIEIEGTRDGESWQAYGFRWKPDRLDERPGFATPHMPRLDWQMWFAALEGSCRRTPWFLAFVRRLLEAEPAVLDLLAHDPFEGERPRAVRATLWRYRFADAATRRATGAWWTREELGPYCPPLELRGDGLGLAGP